MKARYYGDNLQVLRDGIATESVDLIYLDPPFNSNASYNVGLLGESGRDRMRGRTAACSHNRSFGYGRCITPSLTPSGGADARPDPDQGGDFRPPFPTSSATGAHTLAQAVGCSRPGQAPMDLWTRPRIVHNPTGQPQQQRSTHALPKPDNLTRQLQPGSPLFARRSVLGHIQPSGIGGWRMRLVALVNSIIMLIGSIVVVYFDPDPMVGSLLGFISAGCILSSTRDELSGIVPMSAIWILGLSTYFYSIWDILPDYMPPWAVIVILISSVSGPVNVVDGITAHFYRLKQEALEEAFKLIAQEQLRSADDP